jgi:hypothetical protein
VAAALLTATLAVGAHGIADGHAPPGAGVALVGVLAATEGAVGARTRRTPGTATLLGVLAAGQLLAHLLLSAAGHPHHLPAGPPTAAMLTGHAVAVLAAAVLLAAADRLCRALSTAAWGFVAAVPEPLASAAAAPAIAADQPLRSALLLAASVSHRGPPVSAPR